MKSFTAAFFLLISPISQLISNENYNSIGYTELRPWGTFTILDEGENYKVKKIVVIPQKRLSLQKHFHRSEHWVIVQGIAKVTLGDQEMELKENEQIFIPKEHLHRVHNIGEIPLIFIETQCGDYLGEDDIVRYSDDFGRNS
jgi:mannose-6-phosphate isomerase-like protein (cupin superfamily)